MIAAGATAGGGQRWMLYTFLHSEPLESYGESGEGLYCHCTVGQHGEAQKLSPRGAKHNGSMQISTANDDVEFQVLPQKNCRSQRGVLGLMWLAGVSTLAHISTR